MPSGFLGPGVGKTAIKHGQPASGWWLAGGAIQPINVLEHVENPANRQPYAGAAANGAWSVSFRTDMLELGLGTGKYTFDCFEAPTNRIGIGTATGAGNENGLIAGGPFVNVLLFATDDHSYIVVSNGTNIQCYRDGAAVGAPIASTSKIAGIARWRSRYVISGTWFDWPYALRAGHVANIALDAQQRTALHAAMMALG